MQSIQSLSPYLIFLPMVGLFTFFLDSSFLAFRNFFPIAETSVNQIYLVNSIGCVIVGIGILYILFRMTEDKSKNSHISIMRYVFFVSQSIIVIFIIITLLQLQKDGTYTSTNVIVLFAFSYGMGLYYIASLAKKFFAWFRIGREFVVLCYALTMCVFIVFLITSIMYAYYEFSLNIYPSMASGNIALQVTVNNPLPSVYDTYFYYTYLLTFVSVYLITLLSLRIYLKKMRPVFFYLLLSIPLIYFLLNLLPFFTAYIASLILYSPTYYGTLYTLFFSGTGPLGGILFSLVLLAVSRRLDNVSVKNYLSISALGMLLFFIVNQNPPLQENLLPPFGIISKSFIGLSCYMIFVGIYSSVTLLSRRNTLTSAVIKELSKDRLFSSAIRSEQVIQVRDIINKKIDQIETFPESIPKELSKDEVLELVEIVKKDLSGHTGQ